MIYRIVLKVGYYERYFDFVDGKEALAFAETILRRSVISEDCKKTPTFVNVSIMTRETAYKEEEEA